MELNTLEDLNPFSNHDYFLNCFDEAHDLHLIDPCFLEPFTLPEFNPFYDIADNAPIAIGGEEEFGMFPDDSSVVNGFSDLIVNFVKDDQSCELLADHTPKNKNTNVGTYDLHQVSAISRSSRKLNGGPSKNLMAERRRRKRLNDRLSMLRSIVPKISKMDRTSILGDTIDYTRELLDKIHKLKEESNMDDTLNFIGNQSYDQNPNQMTVTNTPKIEIERHNHDTRVDVYCTTKPGLLMSTLGALDALGLDIQHCVISSFTDFSIRASCREVTEHRSLVSCEEIKHALYRTAGYGGR